MKSSFSGQEQFSRIVSNGIARYERSGQLFVTSFLTPAQQQSAASLCRHVPHFFAGGRRDAVRARLVVGLDSPDPAFPDNRSENPQYPAEPWQQPWDLPAPDKGEEDFILVLHARYAANQKRLKHSDVLGALIHAGIDRDAIGDIAVSEREIYLVTQPATGQFVMDSLRQIGRIPVTFEKADGRDMPAAEFESMTVNTASMRADCLVAALAHCSRAQAKTMIVQGLVKVNDEVLESVRPLCDNDTISVRRAGKYRIGGIEGVSRKGRFIVHIEKYQ